MAARKSCVICGTNYAKSAYYDHLPCQNKPHSDSGNYVFCVHCNKRVAKKTFHEHRRLGQLTSTSLQTDQVAKEFEPFVSAHSLTQLDRGDSVQSVVAGLDDENYM
ncbi:uncharacterized protein LOC122964750 [Acropora millepora]|uniref:uncharacterized protein LOC122964750 n=1 Tax=Acropora millepora TaxID=45264 RepID=UPI001CF3C162|nr:uncharacterized protein LOC122964750 [Acropora millepora]